MRGGRVADPDSSFSIHSPDASEKRPCQSPTSSEVRSCRLEAAGFSALGMHTELSLPSTPSISHDALKDSPVHQVIIR